MLLLTEKSKENQGEKDIWHPHSRPTQTGRIEAVPM